MQRIERKLDIILAAMGLSERSKYSPAEIEARAENAILKFQKKQAMRGHEREAGKGKRKCL